MTALAHHRRKGGDPVVQVPEAEVPAPPDPTHLNPCLRGGGYRMWQTHLVIVAFTAVVLLLLFHRDVADLIHLWWTSTTFGHCLFIGPVIAWLVWQRRGELVQLTPVGWAPGLSLVAVGGIGWLVGDAASTALVRQVGLVVMLDGAVLALLGPHVARGLIFPMAYGMFLVPFGQEIEAPLQQVTVALIMPMLHATGVPATSDGVLIHAGPYWFEVAEACSGAKFVLSMVAFGVLVANLCFVGWRRRAAFLIACVVVPVLANAVRAWGTIHAAQLWGVERATGFDHVIYGWVFFAVVMAATVALAWRWFDRAPDAPAFDPAGLQGQVGRTVPPLVAAGALLALVAVFPVWSAAASRPAPLPPHIDLPFVPGWQRAPISTDAPWQPWHPGADHVLFGRYIDAAGDAVDVGVAVYARQQEGAELIAFGTGVLREEDRWVRIADLPSIGGGRAMRITAPGAAGRRVERVVATWYAIGDADAASPLAVKVRTAQMRLTGGSNRAIAVHLSAQVRPGHDPVVAIARFRAALGSLPHAAGLD